MCKISPYYISVAWPIKAYGLIDDLALLSFFLAKKATLLIIEFQLAVIYI